MTDDLAAELQSTRKALSFYRAALLLVLLALAGVGWMVGRISPVSDQGRYGEVWTVDLDAARAKAREEVDHGAVDVVRAFFESPDRSSSVHLHTMGFGQKTPLHLHANAEEVSIVVGGTARVRHAWGGHGNPGYGEGTFEEHALVYSPPSCGHEFANPHTDRTLDVLVFATPQFGGNLYVDADDPRLEPGETPYTFDPTGDLPAFAALDRDVEIRRLPGLRQRLLEVLVGARFEVPPNLHSPIFAYVFGGAGSVDGKPLEGGTLVHLESGAPIVFEAAPGQPLGMLLVDTYNALRDLQATVER